MAIEADRIMADVAALTGDTTYIRAIDRIWDNVMDKKLYITGGIGATGAGEAFGLRIFPLAQGRRVGSDQATLSVPAIGSTRSRRRGAVRISHSPPRIIGRQSHWPMCSPGVWKNVPANWLSGSRTNSIR